MDSLNPISQNLKDFAKKQDYRRQFPYLNKTIRQDNKITPFNKDVDSGRYGAVGDRNKSWIAWITTINYVSLKVTLMEILIST